MNETFRQFLVQLVELAVASEDGGDWKGRVDTCHLKLVDLKRHDVHRKWRMA